MNGMVRDYVEVSDCASLDQLIENLVAIRDRLPAQAEAGVRFRGDDHFGRHIAISFNRPLTPEEAACERRYSKIGKLRAVA